MLGTLENYEAPLRHSVSAELHPILWVGASKWQVTWFITYRNWAFGSYKLWFDGLINHEKTYFCHWGAPFFCSLLPLHKYRKMISPYCLLLKIVSECHNSFDPHSIHEICPMSRSQWIMGKFPFKTHLLLNRKLIFQWFKCLIFTIDSSKGKQPLLNHSPNH